MRLSAQRYGRSNFNPRSRMGSDIPCLDRLSDAEYFNPRSRMGSDLRLPAHLARSRNFNPRSRMGSDRNIWRALTRSYHIWWFVSLVFLDPFVYINFY